MLTSAMLIEKPTKIRMSPAKMKGERILRRSDNVAHNRRFAAMSRRTVLYAAPDKGEERVHD